MGETFKVGGIVWRGYRYSVDLRATWGRFGYPGWNTLFVPYRILAITSQRIKVQLLPDSINGEPATAKDKSPLFLDRQTLAARGKQYHTRYHEYFYTTKPERDPEQRYSSPEKVSILNLPTPYTEADVRRAYKRLAKTAHPDCGGSEAAFIELKKAHDAALRSAV